MLSRVRDLLLSGKPVFIHDFSGREDEVDMVFYAAVVTPKHVTMMRTLAGGLICYVMPRYVGNALGLKYMTEILQAFSEFSSLANRRLGYGDPPNFSLWVNHVSVKTGIRDRDRALTIRRLDYITRLVLEGKVEEARKIFYNEFISPGHVPILLGRDLRERKGHTELSIALAELCGLRPSLVITEMLSGDDAMSVDEAKKIASKLGSMVVEGEEIIRLWLSTNQ